MKHGRTQILAALTLVVVLWPLGGAARSVPEPSGPPPLSDDECKVASVDREHLFVAAGVMKGDTLAGIQLADPNSMSTIVRVSVAPGVAPLTLFLHSDDGVIWDIEGATDRVRRAIVAPSSTDRRVGVRGLPAARIEFPEFARCRRLMFPPWFVADDKRDQAFEFLFGRQPERIAFEAHPNLLALPDAAFTKVPPKPVFVERDAGGKVVDVIDRLRGAVALHDLITYHGGGFRVLDAASVVSPVPVIEPETYPGEAGLIQLERARAIRPAGQDEKDAFVEGVSRQYRSKLSPDYRMTVQIDYAITRDVMLPAGLHGGHTKSFLTLAGVAQPRGNAGHGCVYGMTGFTVSEPRCTAGDQIAIPFLQSVDLGADLTACRLLQPPPGAALEAIAIYDTSSRKRPGESGAAPIVVNVRKPGDVFLVLNDLGPAVWRIQPADGTRIVGVLLIGNLTSAVEGIGRATPVVSIDNESRRLRPDPVCAPFFNYVATAHAGGPLALALDAQVKAFTGRRLDGFRGGYGLKEIEIR
jgi:hypothetical protein